MTKLMERDYLYVVWQDLVSRSRFIIGELSKNGVYEFKYHHEHIEKALGKGFTPFVSFPDKDKSYTSEALFAVFSSRLPDRKRKNISEILDAYNMSEFDQFELLKKSGGRSPIDTLEFVEPIFLDSLQEEKKIERDFYIAGTEYHDLCSENDVSGCKLNVDLEVNSKLRLVVEPENEFDKYAVRIDSLNNDYKIGYVPVFFSKAIFDAIQADYHVECKVKSLNMNNCQECIEANVRIMIERSS